MVPVPKSSTGTMMQWASGTGTTQTGTGTNSQRGTGTGTSQSGTGTTTSSSTVFAYFAPLSSVFMHRLFKNPKKRLMRVQIRVRLSEKCTINGGSNNHIRLV